MGNEIQGTQSTHLGRTVTDILGGGTLGLAFETRNIVVAQGIQFTNADNAEWPEMLIPTGLTAPISARGDWSQSLRTRAPLAIATTADGFEYVDFVQGVRFVVSVVTTKDAYRTALLTPDTHVIYHGHARYGRGPCFGILPTPSTVSPTEDWENGTSPATTGLFRMGYPYIGLELDEILEHGYTCDLVEDSIRVTAAECDPDTAPFVGSLQAKFAIDIDPALPAQAKNRLNSQKWWAYRAWANGKVQWHVLLKAGWSGTVSAPSDLGATTPACKVFCHFGCSTFRHNHSILRRPAFKGWAKAGDANLAYFTTELSPGPTTTRWLYHLFTYPRRNAFLDWEPSLDYAVEHTNADLAIDAAGFRLI